MYYIHTYHYLFITLFMHCILIPFMHLPYLLSHHTVTYSHYNSICQHAISLNYLSYLIIRTCITLHSYTYTHTYISHIHITYTYYILFMYIYLSYSLSCIHSISMFLFIHTYIFSSYVSCMHHIHMPFNSYITYICCLIL